MMAAKEKSSLTEVEDVSERRVGGCRVFFLIVTPL